LRAAALKRLLGKGERGVKPAMRESIYKISSKNNILSERYYNTAKKDAPGADRNVL
jgi:hypothetical protein